MSGGAKSVRIGTLSDEQLERAYAIKRQYLDDGPLEEWVATRRAHPDLFLGCVRDGELIGVAYGHPSPRDPHHAILHGIAVVEEQSGRGYGSQLLESFCQQALRAGCATISVGSAGGYVDHFYVKNGFRPVAYHICVPSAQEVPEELRAKYAVVSERLDGDLRRLSVHTSRLDNEFREQLLRDFGAREACAIMMKRLGGPTAADRDNPKGHAQQTGGGDAAGGAPGP